MSLENWSALVGGVIVVGVGFLIIRYRVAITRASADAQRAFNGKLGERIARGGTPFWTGFVGFAFVAIGVGMSVMGLFRRDW
jgi:hypothetical protein